MDEHHDYFFCPPSSLCVATYDNHKSRSVDTGLDLHASTTVVARDCIVVAPFLGFLVVNDGGVGNDVIVPLYARVGTALEAWLVARSLIATIEKKVQGSSRSIN